MSVGDWVDRLWHLVSEPEPPIAPPPVDPGITKRSAEAVKRAHRVVDLWDARTQMGAALQWERQFWERMNRDGQSGDG